MRSENDLKMKTKRSLFAKWAHTPHFAKWLLFVFILPSFCRSIFVVISNSALTIATPTQCLPPPSRSTHDAATPSLLPSTLYRQCNSITTRRHHSHARYQACTSREWPQTTATRAQMTATRCLGSRYTFFLFVCSFCKLTNCNILFLGSILLVTTGADVAQPTPTPTRATPPPHPNGM
jgi:hypothetical protein